MQDYAVKRYGALGSHATTHACTLLFLLEQCLRLSALTWADVFWGRAAIHIRLCFTDQSLCKLQECRFNACACLGTALVDLNASLLCEFCDVCIAHLWLYSLITLVGLVGYHNNLHVSLPMLLHFCQPHVQIREAFLLEQIEAKNDALSTLVVGIRNSAITFLPSCVPYLKLDLTVAMVNWTEAEINADCRRVVLNEVIICKSD